MDDKLLIMVVDDQPDFIDGVKLILETEGYKVWTASDGKDALDQLLHSFKQRNEQSGRMNHHTKYLPDLILADIMMPIMDGYTFHDKVRSNPYLNHIPFIFLTAKTDNDDVRHGKEMGADDYLTKPCQPDDLLATVRGKLKLTSQRKALAHQFTGSPGGPSAVGIFVIVAVIVIIVIITVVLTLLLVG